MATLRQLSREPRRMRFQVVLLLLVGVVVLTVNLVHRMMTMPTGGQWNDAYVYIDGARALVGHPSSLYGQALQQLTHTGAQRAFIYPPAAAALFVPLLPLQAIGGYPLAAATWTLIDAVCLVAAAHVIARRLGLSPRAHAIALLIATASSPAALDLYSGQINGLLLLLVALAWADDRRARTGVLLGLAVCLKPVAPLLLLLPLVRGRYRVGLIAIAVALGSNLLLVPVIGGAAASAYLFHFLPYLGSHPIQDVNNISLSNLLITFVGGRTTQAGSTVLLSPLHLMLLATALGWLLRLLVLGLWWRAVRRAADWGGALAATCATGVLLNATVWLHYLVLLLPLLLWWMARPRLRPAVIVALALTAVGSLLPGTLTIPPIGNSLPLYTLDLLLQTLVLAVGASVLAMIAMDRMARRHPPSPPAGAVAVTGPRADAGQPDGHGGRAIMAPA